MAHRNVEIVIGRLLTDEGFRGRFLHTEDGVSEIAEAGLELTPAELTALRATGASAWAAMAAQIDARLQKVSLPAPSRGSDV